MSSLTPLSATQTAPLMRAAVSHVEASVSSRSGDGRYRARTHGEAPESEQTATQTVPPDRGPGGARGRRHDRSGDDWRDDRTLWPSAPFFAQHLSQEALPADTPTLGHAAGTAKYPSLGFNSEIFLPGEAVAAPAANLRRVDITV